MGSNPAVGDSGVFILQILGSVILIEVVDP